jgi:two-component system KDP operon response regulator KdpE
MSQPKILLIGDEPNILKTLRRNLVNRGYEVSIALDDAETYEMAQQLTPDLFILNLDFTAVSVNGLEICARLRQVSQSPMIVLSFTGQEELKIKALDLGADDYLVMPFGMEEFLARVRSALRRWMAVRAEGNAASPETTFVHGELIIHAGSHQVVVHGKLIRLTPTEYEMLLYLAQRHGKVVTHQELLRSVWGHESGDQREYLRVFISQLRHKIEDDPLHPVHILTEPGMGYRFASDTYS